MSEQTPIETAESEGVVVTTSTADCGMCGKPFPSKRMNFLGLTLTFRVCHECSERIEARKAAEAEERRILAEQRRQQAREADWLEFCPKEFRLTSEGGKTELAKLELRQPKLKDLLLWKGPRGLIIRGPTGSCKTRSVWRLIRVLYLLGKEVKFFTAAQFDRECRDAGGDFTLTKWFKALVNCDVLVLDDLGKQAWTPATEATWFDVTDQRTREDKPIIVTTNDTGETLSQRMAPERAEPTIRRLRDYCDVLIFT